MIVTKAKTLVPAVQAVVAAIVRIQIVILIVTAVDQVHQIAMEVDLNNLATKKIVRMVRMSQVIELASKKARIKNRNKI